MKLKSHPRVFFNKNPIVEVLAQIRFNRLLTIEESLPIEFQERLLDQYPIFETTKTFSAHINIVDDSNGNPSISSQKESQPTESIKNFRDIGRVWTVTLASNFLMLSCAKYSHWGEFKERLEFVIAQFRNSYSGVKITERIGLRYTDIIDRVALDIQKSGWTSLLQPFLLGPFHAKQLIDTGEVPEISVEQFSGVSHLDLGNTKLIIQNGLVRNTKTDDLAFRIDFDHYQAKTEYFDIGGIIDVFELLHSKSWSVFRSCIKDRLYESLEPHTSK